jgi:hypothetical protein
VAYTPEFDFREDYLRNYIINGDMRISQRGTSFASLGTNGVYTLDRWCYFKASGSAVHTVSQDTDVPTFAQAGYSFQNSLRANLVTASASLGSTDSYLLFQRIEGYNFASLAQKPFTVSFWVKATLPGTYCIYFKNGSSNVGLVKEYTINESATWEKKVLQITPTPANGTWNFSNGLGLELGFTIAAGSNNMTASADTWNSGIVYLKTANQVNGVASGATDFRITGVMLNEGTEALPFSLASKNFATELALCYRYYQINPRLWCRGNTAGNSWYFIWNYNVRPRGQPLVSLLTTTPYTENVPNELSKTGSGSTLNAHANEETFYAALLTGFTGLPSGGVGFISAGIMAANVEL